MKYVKMLGLAMVAAMALMAVIGASTASATELCAKAETSGCANKASRTIESSLSGSAVLETIGGNPPTVLDTCTVGGVSGTAEGGGSGKPVSGAISSLSWGKVGEGCTKTTDTQHNTGEGEPTFGELEVSWLSGTDNGTLTAKKASVTVNTIFGSCIYGTGAKLDLGTLKGGEPASIEINTVVPKQGGNAACPAETRWTAKYVVTSSAALYIGDS